MFTTGVILKILWLAMFPAGGVFIACILGKFMGAYDDEGGKN